jgi:prepilin signal peptidase PulO-like enzyme (type II secretory pathway)
MAAPAFLIFLLFSLPASWIDIRSYRIPDALVFPCFMLICGFYLLIDPGVFLNHLGTALMSALFFLLIRRICGGIGLGDVKFAALIGLCCGLPWTCIAFLAAALTGILGILIRDRTGSGNLHRPIPFAPFLSAGTIAAYFFSKFLRIFNFF